MGHQDCFCRRRRVPYGDWRHYTVINVRSNCQFVLVDLPPEPDELQTALDEIPLTPLKARRGDAAIYIDPHKRVRRRVVVEYVSYPNVRAYDVDTGQLIHCNVSYLYATNEQTRAFQARAVRCFVPKSHIVDEALLQEALEAAEETGREIEAAFIGWDDLSPVVVQLPGSRTDIPGTMDNILENGMVPSIEAFVMSPAARESPRFQKLYPLLPPVKLPPCGQFVESCQVLHVEGDVAYVTWDELLPDDDFSCPILERLRGEPEQNYEALSLERDNLCFLYLGDSDFEVRRCNIEWVSNDGQEIKLRYVDCGTSIRSRVDQLRLTALPHSARKDPPMAVRVSFDIPVRGTAYLAPPNAIDRGPGKKQMTQVSVVDTETVAAEMAALLKSSLEVDMYIVDLDENELNVPEVIFQMDGQPLSLIALENISKRGDKNTNIISKVDVRVIGGRARDEKDDPSPSFHSISVKENLINSGVRQINRHSRTDQPPYGHPDKHPQSAKTTLPIAPFAQLNHVSHLTEQATSPTRLNQQTYVDRTEYTQAEQYGQSAQITPEYPNQDPVYEDATVGTSETYASDQPIDLTLQSSQTSSLSREVAGYSEQEQIAEICPGYVENNSVDQESYVQLSHEGQTCAFDQEGVSNETQFSEARSVGEGNGYREQDYEVLRQEDEHVVERLSGAPNEQPYLAEGQTYAEQELVTQDEMYLERDYTEQSATSVYEETAEYVADEVPAETLYQDEIVPTYADDTSEAVYSEETQAATDTVYVQQTSDELYSTQVGGVEEAYDGISTEAAYAHGTPSGTTYAGSTFAIEQSGGGESSLAAGCSDRDTETYEESVGATELSTTREYAAQDGYQELGYTSDNDETVQGQHVSEVGLEQLQKLETKVYTNCSEFADEQVVPVVDEVADGDGTADWPRFQDTLAQGGLWLGRVVSVRGFAEVNILPIVYQESLDQLELDLAAQGETLPPYTGANALNQQQVVAFVTEGRGHRAQMVARLPQGGAKVWLIDYERMATASKVVRLPDHLHSSVLPAYVIKVSPNRQQFSGMRFADFKRFLEETVSDVMVSVECLAEDGRPSLVRLYTEDGVDIMDAYDMYPSN